MWCCAPAMYRSSRRPNARSRTCWSECDEHNQVAEARPLTAKTSSPLGSANAIKYLIQVHQLVSNNCPIHVCGQAWTACRLDNMCGPCGLTTQILAPPCGWRIYVESPDVLV